MHRPAFFRGETVVRSLCRLAADERTGEKEDEAANNPGSRYDAQALCFTAFADRPDLARRQIEQRALRRIEKPIESDSRQPAELRRTLALTYSTYDLLADACTTQIAATQPTYRSVGLGDGRWPQPSSRLGLAPAFYAKEREWTHVQIHAFDCSSAAVLLNFPWQHLLFSKARLIG